MSDKNQFEMRDLVDCIFYLHEVFDDLDKVSAWMMTKNPHLGNVAPMDLFWVGRGHKVLAFVKGALEDRLGIDASEGRGAGMNPLECALNNYFGITIEPKTDATLADAFKAGWDARNADVYGKLKNDLDLCKCFLEEMQNLQLSNGYADRAKKLLEHLK